MLAVIAALEVEIRPLIARLGLPLVTVSGGLKLFADKTTCVLVTGIGRNAATLGVGWLAGRMPDAISAWVNFGVAGCRTRAIGDLVVAGRICEMVSGRSWYPPRPVKGSWDIAELWTVDAVQEYQGSRVYDMEAAAFYATATRFATGELVQVGKLVSDNSTESLASLNKQQVAELMAAELDQLLALLDAARGLAADLPDQRLDNERFDQLVGRYHFTVAQQHLLRRLLCQFRALDIAWEKLDLFTLRGADGLLAALENAIAVAPVRYQPEQKATDG